MTLSWSSLSAELRESENDGLSRDVKGTVQLAITLAGDRLVAVGERGSVYLSSISRSEWKKIDTPVEATLTDVFFVDKEVGWAVGHGGIVLSTTDGGETWKQVLDGTTAAKLELAAAQQDTSEFSQSRLRKAERLVHEGADKPFLAAYFLDRQRGIVVGAYGLIYRTEDSGVTWRSMKGYMDNRDERHLYHIDRLASGELLVVGEEGRVYRQDAWDGQFRSLDTPFEGTLFGSVNRNDVIVAYGIRGNAFRSIDRGISWQKIELPPISVTSGIVNRDGNFVLGNEYGQLFISVDGGKQFKNIDLDISNPITGIVEIQDRSLAIAGVRGIDVHNNYSIFR